MNGLTAPVFEYSHAEQNSEEGKIRNCSVTGGYVVWSNQLPSLKGRYIFGDYCTGKIWTIPVENVKSNDSIMIQHTPYSVSAFGKDEPGNIYVADVSGNKVYRIEEIVTGMSDQTATVFSIYPNPAEGVLNVKFGGKVSKALLRNTAGVSVAELRLIRTGDTEYSADISSITAGVYSLELVTEQGSLFDQVVITK
jgi:hypothetical protein